MSEKSKAGAPGEGAADIKRAEPVRGSIKAPRAQGAPLEPVLTGEPGYESAPAEVVIVRGQVLRRTPEDLKRITERAIERGRERQAEMRGERRGVSMRMTPVTPERRAEILADAKRVRELLRETQEEKQGIVEEIDIVTLDEPVEDETEAAGEPGSV